MTEERYDYVSLRDIARLTARDAQAGEAGTAETTEIGSVHEHAVRDSECAQNQFAQVSRGDRVRTTIRAMPEIMGECADAHRATHEPSQSTLSRPLRVSVAFRGGCTIVENTRLISTVTRKPPVPRGHREFIGKVAWR